jgi:hypothetical protein
MPRPDTRLQIAFDLAAGGVGDFFTLNDTTKGELDNTTYGLAGDILEDVTGDMRSLSLKRGRSRELERFDSGGGSINLRNDERKYDPSAGTAITPYGASMRPRKEVVITSNGQPIFKGVVQDWDLLYSLNDDHIASVKITDGFAFLAQQNLTNHTAVAQTTGERIEAVLDRPEISWPTGERDISTGEATLQADVVAADNPVNVLSYLQSVELAEPGALFMSNDGLLTFRERTDLQGAINVVFSDTGTDIPFTSIDISYGVEEMKNRVTIERLNGGTAVSSNTDSITNYGAIDFSITNSLLADDTQTQRLADYLVNLFGEPQVRVDAITVDLNALTVTQVNTLLGLELADVVEVKYTPSGIGDEISQVVAIDSISHDIDAFNHIVRFDLSQTRLGFILDSDLFGVLDVNKLGF